MLSVTQPRRSDNNGPQPHLVISAHDGIIWRLAYLPDGQRVVTGSKDGTVKVWNLDSGEQYVTSMEHESEIKSFAVTRDGTKIISADEDGNIKVWNVKSHELVKEWIHPESSPEISISPDDRLVAVGAWRVGIYTMEGRQRSVEVGKAIRSLCFSPDGTKLACGTLRDIRVYDVVDGTLILGPLRGHEKRVNRVLWSGDGRRLFSASEDKAIRCWNSDTGEQIGHPWTGHKDTIYSLSLARWIDPCERIP